MARGVSAVSHDADDHALEHAVTRCVRDGRPLVALSAWSVDLVEGLIDRPIPRVWDEHADPFTNSVRMVIVTLRRKLGDPSPIETVRGAGYRI